MQFPDNAYWIGSDHPFDLFEAYVNFRRDVTLAEGFAHAELTITADSRYRLWINGVSVARGPARCWPQAQSVDVIDVVAHLRAGSNAIAVQVYSPGYSHFAYAHRGAAGLLACLSIDGEGICVTDTSWSVRRDRSWQEDVRRVSIYGSGVERRDLALVDAWQTEACDRPRWNTARIVAPAHSPLWSGLSVRDVPQLIESTEDLRRPCFFRRGQVPGGDRRDPHAVLRAAWAMGSPAPAPEGAGTVRFDAGETAIWVFDLGSSCVCQGSLAIEGALGGERISISYAEKLRDGALLLPDPETYCRMRPTDDFVLRAGSQSVETFSLRGGRYLVFLVAAPRPVALSLKFQVHKSLYPVIAKPLNFGDEPELAAIASMCARTLLACLQDGFVDSVWRESSQWLGDCVAEAFAFAALSDDLRPLRRAILMAGEGAYNDGVLPSVLPGDVHAYTITDYNFSWVELLDLYNEHPAAADRQEFIRSQMPVLVRMLDRFDKDCDDVGLLRSQPGRRLFLDWSPVDRREPNLTYNGRYLHALEIAGRIARAADDEPSSERWALRADALRGAIRARFCRDGNWLENPYGAPASQLALALQLLTNCASLDDAQVIADRIIERSLDLDDAATGGKLVLASPFMHHYVFLALERLGRHADILDIIRRRWGRWAATGEPTTWENWNVDFPDGSKCHGFSAHPLGWMARFANPTKPAG